MAGAFDLPAQGGRIVFVGLFDGDVSFNDPNFHRRELTVLASRNALPENFRESSLIESGRLDTTPWITHRSALPILRTGFQRSPPIPASSRLSSTYPPLPMFPNSYGIRRVRSHDRGRLGARRHQ